jgi:polysaccharide deacetylase family protein (PEP-CTERM system associated)
MNRARAHIGNSREYPSSGQVSAIVNAMTVDVEDYFQVSAFDRIVPRAHWEDFDSRVVTNTNRLLEVFDDCGVHATFFVLGWVAEHFPRLVRQIAQAGHEVASHGFHHQLLYLLTPRQFRDDVRSAKATIESVIGKPVLGYRAPSFSVVESSLWALDVLIEEGYVYDTSIFPVHHTRYGIPNAKRHAHVIRGESGCLVEFPPSTVRVAGTNLPIAGGGYFRLFPYGWTRWGIRRVNLDEGQPVVFYFHPWEIDPGQPRFDVGFTTRIRHYGGLTRTIPRLRRLLNDFEFNTVAAVLERDESVDRIPTVSDRRVRASLA